MIRTGAFVLATIATGMAFCADGCRPWADMSCARGDSMDVVFAFGAFSDMCNNSASCGTNPASIGTSGTCIGKQVCTGYKTHAYCGKVDKFSSFTLQNSFSVLGQSSNEGPTRYLDIAMYGSGGAGEHLPYENMTTRTAIADFTHPDCNNTLAIANFLIYNITLDSGNYKYKHNAPSGNGFVPTCSSSGTCDFDTGSVCITNPNYGDKGNCGVCAKDVPRDQNSTNDVRVLVSYYGTDSNGRAMLSGSSNPLNFRQFAVTDVASKIGKDVRGVKFPIP
eukprot:TRINITY_DN6473_c0_g1_i1.p1 TRINITY_DN6473_c0_g1~~TRINITY_DN6473_c0_g1_i1.p1  ORF type:complete len:278 (+),score=42.27 TRINITY_DN6473_c0_g1_i1:78-911(+)